MTYIVFILIGDLHQWSHNKFWRLPCFHFQCNSPNLFGLDVSKRVLPLQASKHSPNLVSTTKPVTLVVQKFNTVYIVKMNFKNQTFSMCSTFKSNPIKIKVPCYIITCMQKGTGTMKELRELSDSVINFKNILMRFYKKLCFYSIAGTWSCLWFSCMIICFIEKTNSLLLKALRQRS